MLNPFVEEIKQELAKIGINNAILIDESYYPQSFGNAEAIFEVGGLILRFTRDKGQNFVDLASSHSPTHYYLFTDVSVAMGWEILNDVINMDEPISLNKALTYFKNNFNDLYRAFSDKEIMQTNAKIKDVENKFTKAMFG